MNCKSCNTKIPSSKNSCPACGRAAPAIDLGASQNGSSSSGVQSPLSDSALTSPDTSKKSSTPKSIKSKKSKGKATTAIAKPKAKTAAKPKATKKAVAKKAVAPPKRADVELPDSVRQGQRLASPKVHPQHGLPVEAHR